MSLCMGSIVDSPIFTQNSVIDVLTETATGNSENDLAYDITSVAILSPNKAGM